MSSPLAGTEQPDFGRRLRELRRARGLTQGELASSGVSASYVSLLEAGKRVPTAAAVQALSSRLEVPREVLLRTPDPASDRAQLRGVLVLADHELHEGSPRTALQLLAPHVKELPDGQIVAADEFRAHLLAATAHERAGELYEAVRRYEAIRVAAERDAGLPWLPTVVSLVRCYRDLGEAGRAVDLGEKALVLADELGLVGLGPHVQLVSTLAGVYSDRGDLARAAMLLDALLQAEPRLDNQERGYAYWNAAMLAAEQNRSGEALSLIDRAHALLADGDDVRNQARVKVARAWILLNQADPKPQAARKMLQAALPDLKQHAGREAVSKANTELAHAALQLGEPEQALAHAEEALEASSVEQPMSAARARAALAAALVALEQPERAAEYLDAAAELLTTAQAPRQAAALWRQLAALYKQAGDQQSALNALERALDTVGVAGQDLSPVARVARATPGAS